MTLISSAAEDGAAGVGHGVTLGEAFRVKAALGHIAVAKG